MLGAVDKEIDSDARVQLEAEQIKCRSDTDASSDLSDESDEVEFCESSSDESDEELESGEQRQAGETSVGLYDPDEAGPLQPRMLGDRRGNDEESERDLKRAKAASLSEVEVYESSSFDRGNTTSAAFEPTHPVAAVHDSCVEFVADMEIDEVASEFLGGGGFTTFCGMLGATTEITSQNTPPVFNRMVHFCVTETIEWLDVCEWIDGRGGTLMKALSDVVTFLCDDVAACVTTWHANAQARHLPVLPVPPKYERAQARRGRNRARRERLAEMVAYADGWKLQKRYFQRWQRSPEVLVFEQARAATKAVELSCEVRADNNVAEAQRQVMKLLWDNIIHLEGGLRDKLDVESMQAVATSNTAEGIRVMIRQWLIHGEDDSAMDSAMRNVKNSTMNAFRGGIECDVSKLTHEFDRAQDRVEKTKASLNLNYCKRTEQLIEQRQRRDEIHEQREQVLTVREAVKNVYQRQQQGTRTRKAVVQQWLTTLSNTGQGGELVELLEAHEAAWAMLECCQEQKRRTTCEMIAALEERSEIETSLPQTIWIC